MKYGKYLEDKQRPEWADYYLDYKGLKVLLDGAMHGCMSCGT
jgi:SPX domain protein involved in polyphosphate accumulation